jgi:Bifunctional DNA primase/polymerase, N-terminal
METLAFALEYVQQGISVIPLRPGTKIPLLGSWEPYQRKLAPNEQIEVWFSNGHAENNIAIVTGKISHIIAFDIDGEEASTHFNKAIESLDDEGLKTALKETMRIRTANGNTNIVIGFKEEEFTYDDDKLIANCVLWTSGKHNEIRVKGERGYIVAAPSVLTNGNRYEIINGSITTVPTLSKTQINKLNSAIRNQASTNTPIGADLIEEDVFNIVAILKPHYQQGNRNDFTMYLSGLMRKEGVTFESGLKVIETIAADDEEKSARIRTLQETYKKEDLDGLSGYAGLLLILINQTRNEENAKQILKQVKSLFPKTKASKEEYKSQRPYLVELDKHWEEKENNNKKTSYIQKHHDGDLLAEAIIIGRKPYFAVAAPKVGNPEQVSITLQESIQIDETTILKPLELTSYINKPYTFKSVQEFHEFVEDTRGKNLDGLFRNVKSIWEKYVDADDFHISICAADTIFTYFQDKIGLTHYLFFVGGNSSGKSNNLTVLHFVAYRNMMSSGMTAANVYQFLGSREEGIGTICEDEADNIDEDREKMKVYKNGYTTGFPYHRTDTSSGRQQLKFNTFSFKAFAAEKLPDSVKAKGFNQRIIELPCVYGSPKYDISEVVNPAGEEEYQQLLDELLETRNALLVYRLLHFKDKIPNIKLNIQNREKQLFKPVLRVFQNTQTLGELLPVISNYISQRRQSNANTLHAFLYRTIKELVQKENSYKVESSLIWNTVKDTPGSPIPNRPQSYDSTEFGVLSQKEIVQTLSDVFGAERSRDKTSRKLVFDPSKLDKLGKIYDLDVEVKLVTHMTHMTHVGLDMHLQEQPGGKEINISKQENTNISNKRPENNENTVAQGDEKGSQSSTDVSQASHVSPTAAEQREPDLLFEFQCYYCDSFKTNSNDYYEGHTVMKHGQGHPCYPSKADLEKLGLKAQGKSWEI